MWTGQLDRGPVLENMFWFAANPPMSVTHKINYCNCHYVTCRLRCNNSFTWVISNHAGSVLLNNDYRTVILNPIRCRFRLHIYIKSVNIVLPHSTCAVNCEWSIWNILYIIFNFQNPSKLEWPFITSKIPSKFMLRKNLHQIFFWTFWGQKIVTDVHNLWLAVTCDWRVCLIGSTTSYTPSCSFCPTFKQG